MQLEMFLNKGLLRKVSKLLNIVSISGYDGNVNIEYIKLNDNGSILYIKIPLQGDVKEEGRFSIVRECFHAIVESSKDGHVKFTRKGDKVKCFYNEATLDISPCLFADKVVSENIENIVENISCTIESGEMMKADYDEVESWLRINEKSLPIPMLVAMLVFRSHTLWMYKNCAVAKAMKDIVISYYRPGNI